MANRVDQCVLEHGHEGRHQTPMGKGLYQWSTRTKVKVIPKTRRFGKTVCERQSRYGQTPCFRYKGHNGPHRYRKDGTVHEWSEPSLRCTSKNTTQSLQCRGLTGHTEKHWARRQGKLYRWGSDGIVKMTHRLSTGCG
jgi:hypothetical protein